MTTFTWTCFQRSGSLSGNLSVWFCCVCPQKYSTCVFFCSPGGLSDRLRRLDLKRLLISSRCFYQVTPDFPVLQGERKSEGGESAKTCFPPFCLWCPLLLGVSSHGHRGQTMLLLFFIVCAWRTGEDRCSFMDGGLCVTTFTEQITQILEQKVSFNGEDVTLTLIHS